MPEKTVPANQEDIINQTETTTIGEKTVSEKKADTKTEVKISPIDSTKTGNNSITTLKTEEIKDSIIISSEVDKELYLLNPGSGHNLV